MSTKKLIYLASIVVFTVTSGLAIATLFSVFSPASTPTETFTAKETPLPLQHSTDSRGTSIFDAQVYYKTIIDNNLFRPLGWRPPRPQEPYRLIGTILPKDTDAPPRAVIQTTAGKKLHIVATGEKLDADTTLTAIEQQQVALSTGGKHSTLRLSTAAWLR